jgi:23S rRNA (uracil1939-C5)-methyltransferase
MIAGDHLRLTVEKPAAGGRMIARHDGAIVLVSGAIPGEVVEAEVEKVQRGTVWARTLQVLEGSADRQAAGDVSCGGNVLAHIAYERQLTIKRDIIIDAFRRIGRLPIPDFTVAASLQHGYRMRARLHVADGRIGFFREGTHELCDPASTGQLLPETLDVMQTLATTLSRLGPAVVDDVEVAENAAGSERALHLSLRGASDPSRLGAMPPLDGVRGVSCGPSLGARPLVLWGTPDVTDVLTVPAANPYALTLTRQAHSFFQANRYLLPTLVGAVTDEVPPGRVLDLYAGVGLFSVALAARGDAEVVAVEGERHAAQDLKANAARFGDAIEARHQSVEAFLATRRTATLNTVIVDPPRTGMTRDALRGALALSPHRLVYVSCDVATLARDARTIVESGYRLSRVLGFDLFPNTAHVETLVTFDAQPGAS